MFRILNSIKINVLDYSYNKYNAETLLAAKEKMLLFGQADHPNELIEY